MRFMDPDFELEVDVLAVILLLGTSYDRFHTLSTSSSNMMFSTLFTKKLVATGSPEAHELEPTL